jgi:hypothetical protein
MPNLPREWACEDEMAHGLWDLIPQQAPGVVLQASPSQALRGPAAIKACKPAEELDAERHPRLPGELP